MTIDAKKLRKFLVAGLFTFGGLTLAACTDEDGDGAVTDEEIGELQEDAEDLGDDIAEEIDEGVDEIDE